MARIFILNGVNLGALGERRPEVYGTQTLQDIEMALDGARAGGGWDELRRRTHSLKGIAATFGFPRLTQLAQPIEGLIDAGHHDDAERQCAALLQALRDAQREARSEALTEPTACETTP